MNPSDAASLEFARSLSSWGEVLVWLGVAMEGPEAVELIVALRKWISLKRYISQDPPHPEGNWICGLIAVFGLVVLVIGLSLEIPGHRMELRVTDAENRRLAKELRDSVIGAGEANELAGQANERAANIEQTNLVLRTMLAELEENLYPRYFSDPSDAIGHLGFAHAPFVLSGATNSEAVELKNDISNVLVMAGWKIVETPKFLENIQLSGIRIGFIPRELSITPVFLKRVVKADDRNSTNGAVQLVLELKKRRMLARFQNFPPILLASSGGVQPPGIVVVWVGEQPKRVEAAIFRIEEKLDDPQLTPDERNNLNQSLNKMLWGNFSNAHEYKR